MQDGKGSEVKNEKSPHALREEAVLAFWKKEGVFEKTLAKNEGKGREFVFYEGPPTANGKPGIHHLEARAFKDAIPRYKTMRGYHVRRKGGWDTHGLPVELQVEKELSLKSKKEIESYGIAPFNEKCKESVWKYVHEWEDFTNRMGYWVDLKNPYITYKPQYIESVWNVIKEVDSQKLLYKDYKVVPWCPRCGTALSSHELAQGYEEVKDLSVYVKFKVQSSNDKSSSKSKIDTDNLYFLAWTTTPWTLPGNVGLAVAKDVMYVEAFNKETGDKIILSKRGFANLGKKAKGYEVVNKIKGQDLIGFSYEPLYPFLKENISGDEKKKLENAFKVYTADFVTTEDGTGIVHTAVMYGQDDFELGTKVGLPKYHLVNEDGTFKKEAGFLAGRFVKEKDANGKPTLDIDILNDLKEKGFFFAQENVKHSYPHCWRCHTPLIYFARDSWYIKMSALRNRLVKENESIHWEPEHIREGRFGEWLHEVKDWAISRERYWGTPLPVWVCGECGEKKVVGSADEVKQKPKNRYFVMRHGEAENNVKSILNGKDAGLCHLTEKGKGQVDDVAKNWKLPEIDLVYISPFVRARETVNLLKEAFHWTNDQIIVDDRLRELGFGGMDGGTVSEFSEKFPLQGRFERMPEGGGELYGNVKKRTGDLLYEIEDKYQDKNILIVTHATTAMMLMASAKGLDRASALNGEMNEYIDNAEVREVKFEIMPHNAEYELDLHKPYIDEVTFKCKCGGEMKRVKEVMDVWFDSGAMPFAQDHYPFEHKKDIDGGMLKKAHGYPADFISEAIDQTRGWFYTLHAVGILMGKGKAYKNVVCLGHILDEKGQKMSKHIGNVVNPFAAMDKYGADALRFWMYSVNQPGDSKNFDEKTVDEVIKKVFNLTLNVVAFYKMYEDKGKIQNPKSKINPSSSHNYSNNILDRWIIARLNQLTVTVTNCLDDYIFFEPTRAIRDFVGDLSQWYLRRSRDRFKGDDGADRQAALDTTRHVLLTLSKVMAPFTPFLAEHIYKEVGGESESVHLEDWPELVGGGKKIGKGGLIIDQRDERLIADMEVVRRLASRGLEARMAAKINVRQPLAEIIFKYDGGKLPAELIGLIKDEVNVKRVGFDGSIDGEVKLDTTITPELKEEGDLREFMRKIQDMRKEKGLSVGDIAKLVATAEWKLLIDKRGDEIKSATGISEISFGDELGIVVGGTSGDATSNHA